MANNNIEKIKEELSKTIVKNRPIVTELETSFLDYAMSVIVARAIPDARDGLKPVHRRVLYAAYALGMTPDKPYKKSARLVGEVIGKFHPHGDIAAYDTMVRLAQDFSMRYPLIDGHGNFGSVDGDAAAAMRYTEARLSKLAETTMADIEKNTVDFADNYDGSEKEPVVLPSLLPNLLANGSSGIAVGIATNIPPHNLSELVEAINLVAKNPDASINEIQTVLKGPDFPTSAEIINSAGINDYFNTGRGSITIRSKGTYETHDNGKSTIIFTEIPYMVNKTTLIEKIIELVRNEQIQGIADLRDESSREGIRIVIETKRDVVPEVLMNQLYKSTPLQVNFSVNMIALVKGEPKLLNIKEVLQIYIDHQVEVLTRKTQYELKKSKEREHILEGLHIATGSIDEVIKIIRESSDNNEAMQHLMSKFNLSEIQSKAILDMRLRSLSSMESKKIEEELADIKKTIIELQSILDSYNKKIEKILEELDKLSKKFSDKRKTVIRYDINSDISDEDLIPEEDIVVTMSSRGYFKRLPVDTYHVQKRGGVGVIGLNTHEDDDVHKIVVTSTHTDILFFTNLGKIYRTRGHQIPIGSRQSKGIPAINIIGVEKNEKVLTILPINDYKEGYLFFVTKKGISKKTSLSEFERIQSNGKICISLKEGDELYDVIFVKDNDEIYIGGSNGNMIRFNENNVRSMGRTAAGVKAMKLDPSEKVVGLSSSITGNKILSIGSKGVGKVTDVNEYRLTSRNAKGVRTLKVNDKTGKLVYVNSIFGNEDILMITNKGKIIRFNISTVREISRSTSGVKLMNVDEGDKIISVTVFRHEAETPQQAPELEMINPDLQEQEISQQQEEKNEEINKEASEAGKINEQNKQENQ